MIKSILLILVVFLNSINLFSQEKIEFGTYLTENKLGYITIINSDKFGFTSYHGSSPYITMEERKRKTIDRFSCSPSYIINEHGSGFYSIENGFIKLKFVKPEHMIDSVSFKNHETQKLKDTISIKIITKSYIRDDVDDFIGLGTWIKSEDNGIDLRTQFGNDTVININKNQIPMELIINGVYILKVEEKFNQEITLFLNDFKMFTTDNIKNKTFQFDKLLRTKN